MAYVEKHETGQKGLKIVKFSNRNSYYLYIYNKNTKKAEYICLESDDIDYCQTNWLSFFQKCTRRGGSVSKVKKTLIKQKIKEYIDFQFERAQRKEIKEGTVTTIHERVRNRIYPYLEHSPVKTVQDLKRKSFDDFPVFWRDKGREFATINSAITTLNNFTQWLVDEDILDAGKRPFVKNLRNVKDYRKQANPAITGEDWSVLKEVLYRYENLDESWTDDVEEKERWWYRRAFVSWIFFQFHLGCRNHESLKLTYGDIKVEEYKLPNGKNSLRGVIDIPSDTKRGRRTSVMNGFYVTRITQHLNSFQHPKWLAVDVNDETPLFLNPMTGKAMHQETFRGHWKKVIKYAGLENKGYTLYSLRSTHITFQLLNNVSTDDVARNLGTSPEMIRKHYDGVSNILKSDELLKLNRHYFSDTN